MSFILDALKKSEQERKGEPVVKTSSILGGGLSEEQRSRSLIAAGSLILALAGAGAFLFYPRLAEPPAVSEQDDGVDQAQAQAVTKPEKPQAVAVAPLSSVQTGAAAAPGLTPPLAGAASSGGLAVEQKIAALEPPPPLLVESKPKLAPEPITLTPPITSPATSKAAKADPLPAAKKAKSFASKSSRDAGPDMDEAKSADAPTFNQRGQEFEREGLYDLSIREYTKAIMLDPSYAGAYYGRAWAHEGKGNHEQAIRNFTLAIKADPSYGLAFYGRGWAHEQMDHIDLAIEEYSKAIKTAPAYADALLSRGILYFYNAKFEAAADDFIKALDAGDDKLTPYALLWLYVSQARSGKDALKTLTENAQQMNLDAWPGIIVSLFLEKVEAWRVIAGAENPDMKKQLENECVAYFFLGQYYLINGDKDRAAEFFRKTLDTGVTKLRQYAAAEKELKIMEKAR